MAITVFILLNVLCAILRREIKSLGIFFAAIISCIGVACLAQPEFLFGGASNLRLNIETHPCPCLTVFGNIKESDVLECRLNGNAFSLDNAVNDTHNKTNNYHFYFDAARFGDEQLNSSTTVDALDSSKPDKTIFSIKRETFAYLLMVTSGAAFFISVQVNAVILLPKYHFTMLTFWYGVVAVLYSSFFFIVVETPRFYLGSVCLFALAIHVVFAALTFMTANISL